MRRDKAILLTCVLVLTMLVGCGARSETGSSTNQPVAIGQATQSASAEPTTTERETQVTAAEPSATAELSESVAENIEDHAEAEAAVLESYGSTSIVLNGDSISVDGEGAIAAGGTATIAAPGTYSLSGSLTDGQVIVDVEDGTVGLVLNGVDISSSTGPAIYILNAQEAVIVLADNTQNQVSDGDARASEGTEDEPTAAIFSMADLTIAGSGSLEVDGNYQDGITSKDGLLVAGGAITIRSIDDGINVAAGNDGSGFAMGQGRGGGRGQMPGGDQGQFPGGAQPPGGRPSDGQMQGEWPGQDAYATGDNYLTINGGYLVVDAYGDGLDVNGPIEMTDGTVLISGPTENINGALDYFDQFKISGGFLVAAGSAGMAQAPSESSDQYSLLVGFNGTVRAGTLVHIETPGGLARQRLAGRSERRAGRGRWRRDRSHSESAGKRV